MVRIACAGETDPGLTHFSRKRQRLGSTTRVIRAKIRIVEDERNLTTVEGPRPTVKHWSLPSEQVDVRRRGAQGSLAPGLGSRGFAEAIARDGEDIEWLRPRVFAPEGIDDCLGLRAVARVELLEKIFI